MPFKQYKVNDRVRIFIKSDGYSNDYIIEGTITEIEQKYERYLLVNGKNSLFFA